MNSLKRTITLIILVITFNNQVSAQKMDEKTLATFIYKMAKLTDFIDKKRTEYNIVVLGRTNASFKNFFLGKTLNGLRIHVKQIDSTDELRNADILFISDSKSDLLEEINTKYQSRSMLIIGEREGLFRKGASLSFSYSKKSVSLEINSQELAKRKVRMSSSVTSLAKTLI